ncbi:hypothetical protein GIB67_004910 [Kingdonia uniflora]|uniref:Sister chromatid cohesion protein n=1 Tax=Kingdonia uniflora TaxID=39325 RepID=A0A7J7LNM6_9MAGN|nr:hypothetical protein GIB67_004910 [Kingdonia uniflora]
MDEEEESIEGSWDEYNVPTYMKGKVLARAQWLWCDRNSKYQKFNYGPYPNDEEKIRNICIVEPETVSLDIDNDTVAQVCGKDTKGRTRACGLNVSRVEVLSSYHIRDQLIQEKTARLTLEEDLVHVKDKLTTMDEKLSSLAATESPSSMHPSSPIALSGKERPCELISFTGKIVPSGRAIGDSHSVVYNVIIEDVMYNPDIDSADSNPSLSSLNDIKLGTTILYWEGILGRCMDMKEEVRPSVLKSRLGDGLQMSFNFIHSLANTSLEYFNQGKPSGNMKEKFDGNTFVHARLGVSWIYRLIWGNCVSRNKFLSLVVRKFGSPSFNQSVIPFLMYCTEILASLPFTVPDEPLYLIYTVNRVLQVRFGSLEATMKALSSRSIQEDKHAISDENGVLQHDSSVLQQEPYSPTHSVSIHIKEEDAILCSPTLGVSYGILKDNL